MTKVLLFAALISVSSFAYPRGPVYGCSGICTFELEHPKTQEIKTKKTLVKSGFSRSVDESRVELEDKCNKICNGNDFATGCELEVKGCGQRNYIEPYYYYYHNYRYGGYNPYWRY